MALQVAGYPNRFDPTTPLADAYGRLSLIALDVASQSGRLILNVYPSKAAADAGAAPLDHQEIALGQQFTTGATFPTLAALMADPEIAAAYAMLGEKLYGALAASVPALKGATVVAD